MRIPSGINDDDNITIDYDDAVSDMERSLDGSHTSNPSMQYERRESIAADYHRENDLPYMSDHGCYNTF